MSYYRTFLPPKDAVDELRNYVSKSVSYDLDSIKTELRIYCLLPHPDDDIRRVIEHIRYLLGCMKYDVRSDCYKYAVNCYDTDEDESVWYCGWDYSRSEPDTTEEEARTHTVGSLVNLACAVATPDWFDEQEKYYDKMNAIDDEIEYFIDAVSKCYDFEVMDKLKEFDVTDKDFDEIKQEKNGESEKAESRPDVVVTTEENCGYDVSGFTVNSGDCHYSVSVLSEPNVSTTYTKLDSEYVTPTD